MNKLKKIIVLVICAVIVHSSISYCSNEYTEKEIILLVEELIIKKSDMINQKITNEKKKIIEKASAKLIKIGDPAIPHIMKLLKFCYFCTAYESETGWTAFRLLKKIGEPVLKYLTKKEHENNNIIQDLKKQIQKKIKKSDNQRSQPC
ncbi:MAG: hypothetical protein PVH61_40305 [Candidatus Aminicenantes bacterium]|jgi:hypothetical protein